MQSMGYYVARILLFLVGGYVLELLWNWFPSEAFSIPSLSYIYALGIVVFLLFLTKRFDHFLNAIENENNEENKLFRSLIASDEDELICSIWCFGYHSSLACSLL